MNLRRSRNSIGRTAATAVLAVIALAWGALPTPAGAASPTQVEVQSTGWFTPVSCPSTHVCLTAGVDSAGVVIFDPTSPGHPTPTPLPSAPYDCSITDTNSGETTHQSCPSKPGPASHVACPAATQCTALVWPDSAEQREHAIHTIRTAIDTFDPGAPGGAASYPIDTCTRPDCAPLALACPTVSRCVLLLQMYARGEISYEPSGYRVQTFDPASPGTTTTTTELPDDGIAVAMACPTGGPCVVINSCGPDSVQGTPPKCGTIGLGDVITFDPTSPAAATRTHLANLPFRGIACPAATQCTVAGEVQGGNSGSSGRQFTFDPTAPGSGVKESTTGSDASGGIACATAKQCTLQGFYLGSAATFDPTAGGHTSMNSYQPSLQRENARAFGLACPSPTQCTAVGGSSDPQGRPGPNGLIVTFDPKAKAAAPKPAIIVPPPPSLQAAISHGVPLKASCSAACALKVQLLMSRSAARQVGLARGPVVVGQATKKLTKAGKATIRVHFTREARSKLKGRRTVKLTLRVIAKGATGKPTTKTKHVTLRRR